MYFYLNEYSFLVVGAKKSAIYDMKNNQLYSLDEESTKYITLSENGEPIDEFYDKVEIFKDVEKEGLGFVSDKKCYIDKIRVFNNSTSKRKDLNYPFVINAFIRVNNNCEAKCTKCNKMFCPICFYDEAEQKESSLNYEDWEKIIKKVSRLGTQVITFTGGEPLLYKDLDKLVKLTLDLGLKVSVVTSGITDIDEKISKDITIVLTAFEDRNYEEILEKLKDFKEVSVKCVSQDIYDKVNSIIEAKKLENITANNVYVSEIPITKDKLVKFDMYSYGIKKDFDSCLYGKLYVDYDGSVVPCFNEKDIKVGNIKSENFNKVINDIIDNYWHNEKYTSKCASCELIYACNACKCYDSDKYCGYNPLEGTWK